MEKVYCSILKKIMLSNPMATIIGHRGSVEHMGDMMLIDQVLRLLNCGIFQFITT